MTPPGAPASTSCSRHPVTERNNNHDQSHHPRVRRTQRPAVGKPRQPPLQRRRHRPGTAADPAHRHPEAAPRRLPRAILVGVRAQRLRRRRRGDRHARADRLRAPHVRALPRDLQARDHRGRRARRAGRRPHRLADRHRRRPSDRQQHGRAARIRAPRRALHDTDLEQHQRIRRRGGRRAQVARPERPWPRDRGRDEPHRHDRRPVPRLRRHDARRARRIEAAGHVQPLLVLLRQPASAQRARGRAAHARRQRRRADDHRSARIRVRRRARVGRRRRAGPGAPQSASRMWPTTSRRPAT